MSNDPVDNLMESMSQEEKEQFKQDMEEKAEDLDLGLGEFMMLMRNMAHVRGFFKFHSPEQLQGAHDFLEEKSEVFGITNDESGLDLDTLQETVDVFKDAADDISEIMPEEDETDDS